MSSWWNVKLTKCRVDEMSSCQNVKSSKCQIDEMSSWRSVKLMKCQVDEMSSCQNVKSMKCQVDEVSSWQSVKLMKCHVDKMSSWRNVLAQSYLPDEDLIQLRPLEKAVVEGHKLGFVQGLLLPRLRRPRLVRPLFNICFWSNVFRQQEVPDKLEYFCEYFNMLFN